MKRFLTVFLTLCTLGFIGAQVPGGESLPAHNSDTDGYVKEWHNFVLKELPDTPEREKLIQKAEDPEATDPTDPDDLNEMHSSVMDRGIEKILKETTASPEAIRKVQDCVRENGLYNAIKTDEIEKILREDNVELHKTKEIASDIRKFEMSYKDIPLFKVSMGYNVQGALDAYMDETSEGMAVSVAVSGFFKVEADPNLRENAYKEAIRAAEKHLHNEKARNAVVTALKQCYKSHTCDVKALTTDLTEAGIEHVIEHAGLTDAQKKLAYAALDEFRGKDGAIVATSKEMLMKKLQSKGLSPALAGQLTEGLGGLILEGHMPDFGAIGNTAINDAFDQFLPPKQAEIAKNTYNTIVSTEGDVRAGAVAGLNTLLGQTMKDETAKKAVQGALNTALKEGTMPDAEVIVNGIGSELAYRAVDEFMDPETAKKLHGALDAYRQSGGDLGAAADSVVGSVIDDVVKDPVAAQKIKDSLSGTIGGGEMPDLKGVVAGIGSEYFSRQIAGLNVSDAQKKNMMDVVHGIAEADSNAVRGALSNTLYTQMVESGIPPEEADRIVTAINPVFDGEMPDFGALYTSFHSLLRDDVKEFVDKQLGRLTQNRYVKELFQELGINSESIMAFYDSLTVERLSQLSRMTLNEWKQLAAQVFNRVVSAILNIAARHITKHINQWIDKMMQKAMKLIMKISGKLGRYRKYMMAAVAMVSNAAKTYVGKAIKQGANKISKFMEWKPKAEAEPGQKTPGKKPMRVVPRSQIGKMGAPINRKRYAPAAE